MLALVQAYRVFRHVSINVIVFCSESGLIAELKPENDPNWNEDVEGHTNQPWSLVDEKNQND